MANDKNRMPQTLDYQTPEQAYRAIFEMHHKLLNVMQACGVGQTIKAAGTPKLQIDPSVIVHLEFSVYFLAAEMQRLGAAIVELAMERTKDSLSIVTPEKQQ
jgi:hypothetical protein